MLGSIYRPSLALLTDLYQLTMAYGYWKSNMLDHDTVFHMFFRDNPFGGSFTLISGVATLVEYLEQFTFDEEDLTYLRSLRDSRDAPLFDEAFLHYLRELRFSCDVDAMPEGSVAFPHEPIVRVIGPLPQCQLIETALLNIVNFQSLIATKARRIVTAARGEPVLEFGLRRAQGIDGALSASRAAYIGGCAATSNVLAGRLYGIPVKGTHAHSWVMCFADEEEAFDAYADAMPDNCVFLVDTYDTIGGVKNAIRVGHRLREAGHEMIGVRLDSGDLATLSIEARRLLDEAGFRDAAIVASNDLDEERIAALKERGATIRVWGVGTRLVTAFGQPALGGVYKLSAIRRPGGRWEDRVKLCDGESKKSIPGILQVRRCRAAGKPVHDIIYDTRDGLSGNDRLVDVTNDERRAAGCGDAEGTDLLVPVFREGRRVLDSPDLNAIRSRVEAQCAELPETTGQLSGATSLPVWLDWNVHRRRQALSEAGAGA